MFIMCNRKTEWIFIHNTDGGDTAKINEIELAPLPKQGA